MRRRGRFEEREGVSAAEIAPLVARDLQRIAAGDPDRYTCVAVLDGELVFGGGLPGQNATGPAGAKPTGPEDPAETVD